MSLTSRTTSLQAYHMLLFDNALHPEFFQIEGRRRIEHNGYDCEAWVFQGGHAIRFEYRDVCIQEVVTDNFEKLPARGLITTLQCLGERDHEEEFKKRVVLMTSMQTETLADHLYLGTFNEMLDHGRHGTAGAVMTTWKDEAARVNLSLVDMQRYNKEVHVQGYHLRSDCALVLRTQTIYQLK
jgi:hypothetical protein